MDMDVFTGSLTGKHELAISRQKDLQLAKFWDINFLSEEITLLEKLQIDYLKSWRILKIVMHIYTCWIGCIGLLLRPFWPAFEPVTTKSMKTAVYSHQDINARPKIVPCQSISTLLKIGFKVLWFKKKLPFQGHFFTKTTRWKIRNPRFSSWNRKGRFRSSVTDPVGRPKLVASWKGHLCRKRPGVFCSLHVAFSKWSFGYANNKNLT